MPNVKHCKSCGDRHLPPTGKNCRKMSGLSDIVEPKGIDANAVMIAIKELKKNMGELSLTVQGLKPRDELDASPVVAADSSVCSQQELASIASVAASGGACQQNADLQ